MPNTFLDKLTAKWKESKFVCVGLDSSDFSLLQKVVDQTHDLVCAYKINSAFFEAEGSAGWESLKKIIQLIQQNYPDIPIILDAKRGDIGNTNEAYAKTIFDDLNVDATTVHPYLGKESLEPFLKRMRKDGKGIFVLVKTSNVGSDEFQLFKVSIDGQPPIPLYQSIARHVATQWNNPPSENLGVVVGATYPEELKKVREIIGDMPILIPGIGTQGGDLEKTIKAGINSQGMGIIVSSSRGIIFSDNPKEAALKLHLQIQEALKSV